MKIQDQSNKPIIIYVAENDHGDMSYGSLTEQIIKDCYEKGLSTKTFSEFPSQTAKSQKQRARTKDLMSLENSHESVEETAKFLDSQFIKMGNIQARFPMYDETWQKLPEGTTPEQLVKSLEGDVDNPELLRLMKDDLKTGKISGADKIGDLQNFYAYWRSPLHYKKTHEEMAKDIRNNLKEGVPDVIIVVAGTPHIKGLDQQLSEFRDSQKIVVGNFPQGLDPLISYLYSGTPELVSGVGKTVGFEVDLEKKRAVVPKIAKEMIDEKFESKARFQKQKIDALNLEHPQKPSSSPKKSYADKMVGKSKYGFKEI